MNLLFSAVTATLRIPELSGTFCFCHFIYLSLYLNLYSLKNGEKLECNENCWAAHGEWGRLIFIVLIKNKKKIEGGYYRKMSTLGIISNTEDYASGQYWAKKIKFLNFSCLTCILCEGLIIWNSISISAVKYFC